MTAINAVADSYPKDDRTADQRRADALTDICAAVLAGDLSGLRCGTRQGRSVTVELTVPLSAILGHDGQPAELAGYGAIPAAVARALAFDDQAKWRTLITTDAGDLLDYGRTVYEPPLALRDYVIARDRTCSVPNCQRRARESDIDHLIVAEDGGDTSAVNCHPLCPHHHKMEARGRLVGQPPGQRRGPLDCTYPTYLCQGADGAAALSCVAAAVPTLLQ